MESRPLKRLWVFVPDENVKDKFLAILGFQAKSNFEFHKESFSKMSDLLVGQFLDSAIE